MSFLKIRDPAKRNQMVEEYLDLKKNIRDNLLSEKTGDQQLQTDLSEIFKPITETQKAAAKEITGELKPIKEGIKSLPQAITFPAYPSIEVSKEGIQTFEKVAVNALLKFVTKDEADKTFGIYVKDKKFHIGSKPIVIRENDIIVDGDVYEGTPGFWELITAKKPDKNIITIDDSNNYAKLMVETNSIYRNNNPNENNPKGNRRGFKWENFTENIWENTEKYGGYEEYGGYEYEGSGVIVIPSDPNALLERLDLLLASQEAGHTGVGNELVSICDELKRQGVSDTKTYKKLNSIIKNDST